MNIDPMPGGMQLFEKLRPHDLNLEVAVSGKESPPELTYLMFDEPAFNSLEAKNITDAENLGAKLIDRVQVPAVSIESLLQDRGQEFESIDLLTIDVEHHELIILQSFPFDKYLPGIIVVEVKGLDLGKPEESEIYRMLTGKGYQLRSYLFHSAIFVSG